MTTNDPTTPSPPGDHADLERRTWPANKVLLDTSLLDGPDRDKVLEEFLDAIMAGGETEPED